MLANLVQGKWIEGTGSGEPVVDPVSGDELARISSAGIDGESALAFAREQGGPALRTLTYAQRAELLAKVADVLTANRDEYFRISQLNSGATQADASFDVDGALYTIKYYAKIGRSLDEKKMLKEGAGISLSKSGAFVGQHFLTPACGTAVFINAFNFPEWGFCEKAGPALLSGVPIVLKPASPTAWLTHRMVEDVVKAGVLPPGVREGDVMSCTGSADTAAKIRSNENVARRSVRVNIEADSINSATLGPDGTPGSEIVDLLVKEVVREIMIKAGQKCTAIRRVFVPRQHLKEVGDAIAAKLASLKVGNPRNTEVKVGPVVNKAQQSACLAGLRQLKQECSVIFGGDENFQPLEAEAAKSAFVQPTLLSAKDGRNAKYVHDVEVFGPAATLIGYEGVGDLIAMARRGLGSLVASVFSNDSAFVREVVLGIGDLHGRIMVVDSSVGGQQTGHGNVVPSCLHGGPGRAGGGEELAGLRALLLYHRGYVVQGPSAIVNDLAASSGDASLLYA